MTQFEVFQFLCGKINQLRQTQMKLMVEACALRSEYDLKTRRNTKLNARRAMLVRFRADVIIQVEIQRTRLKNTLSNN